jgi:hypothetical protein
MAEVTVAIGQAGSVGRLRECVPGALPTAAPSAAILAAAARMPKETDGDTETPRCRTQKSYPPAR